MKRPEPGDAHRDALVGDPTFFRHWTVILLHKKVARLGTEKEVLATRELTIRRSENALICPF